MFEREQQILNKRTQPLLFLQAMNDTTHQAKKHGLSPAALVYAVYVLQLPSIVNRDIAFPYVRLNLIRLTQVFSVVFYAPLPVNRVK